MRLIWAVVPAAGRGSRFGAEIPKQYAEIAGRAVLWHSLNSLLRHPQIAGVMVALDAADSYWPTLAADTLATTHNKTIHQCLGGATRAQSVRNALQALIVLGVDQQNLIAVHDAARPCLSQRELDAVLAAASHDPHGAILALPARDTIKLADAALRVSQTLDRNAIWYAQTPQVFRLQALSDALRQAPDATDEAQAMERAGAKPILVPGRSKNLKITVAEDLALATFYLARGEAYSNDCDPN
jgi:2-C-methyl-D-erythritol 4-phosphate cytidylyltransferase